jgi:hypothetical protein
VAVVRRAIDAMKAEGSLVEGDITSGRFRRRRGLRVDWACTPWPNASGAIRDASSLDDASEAADGEIGGQLVNGVVNE